MKTDVNNKVNILNNVLLTEINNCAQLITKWVKRKPNKWMNNTIKKKIEERETKKNIWLNNKLNTEALFSYKKLETPEQGTTTMNFILINTIVGTPGIL